MAGEQPTVADIFRRAMVVRRERPQDSYKELKKLLLDEYKGAPFPPVSRLAIPEQDARAPQEDWSAGLPLMLRGIQRENWAEIIDGIVLSLEQTEKYEQEVGPLSDRDEWHDRTVGIDEPLRKGVGKWMPEDLMRLAEKQTKKQ